MVAMLPLHPLLSGSQTCGWGIIPCTHLLPASFEPRSLGVAGVKQQRSVVSSDSTSVLKAGLTSVVSDTNRCVKTSRTKVSGEESIQESRQLGTINTIMVTTESPSVLATTVPRLDTSSTLNDHRSSAFRVEVPLHSCITNIWAWNCSQCCKQSCHWE